VMMDARKIYPRGWHPQGRRFLPTGVDVLPSFPPSRTSVGGVRYYYIDFGISSRDLDSVTGAYCQEPAPELSDTVPYDPYKLDVYVLGMAYKHFLLEKRGRLEFLRPLVEYMTPKHPGDRPSAAEAVVRFREISSTLTKRQLSQRLTPLTPESEWVRRWKDAAWQVWELWWAVKPMVALRKHLDPLA